MQSQLSGSHILKDHEILQLDSLQSELSILACKLFEYRLAMEYAPIDILKKIQLVQDGETIPFCACVHTGNTTLYHDTESQVLLAELDYPAPVENAEQRYLGMETADRNGDGSSDVLLRFSQEDGTLELLFCWDPETGAFRSVPA